jgi:renierapurpurin 18,18'-hydroxylase
MIEKPRIPGAIHLAWPLIRRFTERVFAEDRTAVEAEQRAWDEQGEDWNHEVFPLILDVREVLRGNGVPLRPRAGACAAASLCGAGRSRAAAGDPLDGDPAGTPAPR